MRLTKNESCDFALDFKSQEVFDFLGRRQMRMPVTNFDPTRMPHLLHTHMKGKITINEDKLYFCDSLPNEYLVIENDEFIIKELNNELN